MKIELSPAWATAMVPRLFDGQTTRGDGVSNVAALRGLLQADGAALLWMKGTPPVDFSSIVTVSDRSSDILVRFTNQSGGLDFSLSDLTDNPAIISTLYENAVASGTATWFWLVVSSNIGNNAAALYHSIFGTIGLTGSGEDLEIEDNVIVSGQPYRTLNFALRFPTSWTY